MERTPGFLNLSGYHYRDTPSNQLSRFTLSVVINQCVFVTVAVTDSLQLTVLVNCVYVQENLHVCCIKDSIS